MKIEKTYDSMSIIKGLGAITVCSSHILDCFVWGNGNKPIIWESLFSKPILWYFLWSGGFQVSMFCLISGFFAWKKEIANVKDLVIAIIKRYLNFVTLIFASDFIMYLLKLFNLMPLEQGGIVLANTNMPYTHQVTIIGMMFSSLKLDTSINGALWMIKYLFIGNCVIYVLKYLKNYIKKWILILCVVTLIIALFANSCVFATICGIILLEILIKLPESKNEIRNKLLYGTLLIVLAYLSQNPFGLMDKSHDIYVCVICVVICVCVVYIIKGLKNITWICKYLKNESIAVYCVHIPVIYSVGLFSYIFLGQYLSNINLITLLVYGVSMLLVMVVAYLYQYLFDRYRLKLILGLFK